MNAMYNIIVIKYTPNQKYLVCDSLKICIPLVYIYAVLLLVTVSFV